MDKQITPPKGATVIGRRRMYDAVTTAVAAVIMIIFCIWAQLSGVTESAALAFWVSVTLAFLISALAVYMFVTRINMPESVLLVDGETVYLWEKGEWKRFNVTAISDVKVPFGKYRETFASKVVLSNGVSYKIYVSSVEEVKKNLLLIRNRALEKKLNKDKE